MRFVKSIGFFLLIELFFIIIGGGTVWLFSLIFKVDQDSKILPSLGFLFSSVLIGLFVYLIFPKIFEEIRSYLFISKERAIDFLIAYFLILILFSVIVSLCKAAGLITQFPEITRQLSFSNLGAAFLATVLIGFSEEYIYRGIITVYFLNKTNRVFTVICVSFLFSIGHFNYSGLLPYLTAFILGVVSTIFVLKTKSLYTSIGLHCGWNFIYIIFDSNYNLETVVSPLWGNVFEVYQIGILVIFTIIFYFKWTYLDQQKSCQKIVN